ncbi:hypothetical protein CHU98_g11720 [Xylaria longipes]|nr:hypothetical protein CHU98_g11720 [Xylaria longipes]
MNLIKLQAGGFVSTATSQLRASQATGQISMVAPTARVEAYGSDISLWVYCFTIYVAIYGELFPNHLHVVLAMNRFLRRIAELATIHELRAVLNFAAIRMRVFNATPHSATLWADEAPAWERKFFSVGTYKGLNTARAGRPIESDNRSRERTRSEVCDRWNDSNCNRSAGPFKCYRRHPRTGGRRYVAIRTGWAIRSLGYYGWGSARLRSAPVPGRIPELKISGRRPPGDRGPNSERPRLEYGTLQYTTIQDVFNMVRQAGRGAYLIKKDLKDAFRLVPVALPQRWLLGFAWKGRYFHENCLPFELRTAPFLFRLFAEELHWMLEALLQTLRVAHYLDDFIFVVPPSGRPRSQQVHRIYNELSNALGLIQNSKKDGEGTCLEVLGIEIDTILMRARLSEAKIQMAIRIIDEALAKPTLSRRDIEKLAGYLGFCSSAVPLVESDRPLFHLFTDASGVGIGGFWYEADPASGNWFENLPIAEAQAFSRHRTLDEALPDINIAEIVAIQVAFRLWHERWASGIVVIHTDNTTAEKGLVNVSTRNSLSLEALRDILLMAASRDICFQVRRVTSSGNGLADAFSRFDFATIANLCPHWQNLSRDTRQTVSSNA